MALYRLFYRSDSELSGGEDAMREATFGIADAAFERNARDGITGALMFAGNVFVQLLEGERDALETTFERVCRDMRHRRIMVIDYSPIEERVFDTWAMVAFEGDERARALFPSIGEPSNFAYRTMTATAAVILMQRLLSKRLARRVQSGNDRMIATDLADRIF